MGSDHALRRRGRAAGVEIAQRVAVPCVHFGKAGGLIQFQDLERLQGDAVLTTRSLAPDHEDAEDPGCLRQVGQQRVKMIRLDDDRTDLGMIEDVAQLCLPPQQVDRHADRADPGAGEIDRQELGPVPGHQPDCVALADALCHQPMSDAVHPGVELGVAPPSVAVADHIARGISPCASGQQIADIDAVDQVYFCHFRPPRRN